MAYEFIGKDEGDTFGFRVAFAGDVDGDGKTDLLISAPQAEADGAPDASGEVFLINANDLFAADFADGVLDGKIKVENISTQEQSYKFIGDEIGGSAGRSIASAGDMDGDGLSEFMIGAPALNMVAGAAYLINPTALDFLDAQDSSEDHVIDLDEVRLGDGSYLFQGDTASDQFGQSLSSVGDLDGDGLSEILIGARDTNASGEVYLLNATDLDAADLADGFGGGVIRASNIAAQDKSYTFTGNGLIIDFGESVASAGDVNGDGIGDFLVGAPGYSAGVSFRGEAFLVSGAALAVAESNGDVVGGTLGAAFFQNLPDSYQFLGEAAGNRAGYRVASAGDVDGDGNSDLMISAVAAENGGLVETGSVYLITAADLEDIDLADGAGSGQISLGNVAGVGGSYKFIGTSATDRAGTSIASAGDLDGDGKDEILIGVVADGPLDEGITFLFNANDLAAADALDGTVDGVVALDETNADFASLSASYFITGGSGDDSAGISVAGGRDVTGDGKSDLLVGAFEGLDETFPAERSGLSYLLDGGLLANYEIKDASGNGTGEIALERIALSPTERFEFRNNTTTATAPTDLAAIRDYDGNDLGASGDWKQIGTVDVQGDGDAEFIYVNQVNGRWATVGPNIEDAFDFNAHGMGGDTRVVGIYIDPLVADGTVAAGSPNDSQQRFQNDLYIDNLTVIDAFDFDRDGFQEVYFKVNDGTAYLRALMHADGNIQYANYQSAGQVETYLTGLGYEQSVVDLIVF